MMTREPFDQLDSSIVEHRVNLRENPSRISYRLKIPLEEVCQRMERLGLKTDGRRKIVDYGAVKQTLVQGLSFKDVAEKFNVSEERVRHLATKWGFKGQTTREMDDNLILDRYVNQLKSAEEIHEELGYGLGRIRRRLKELGVARTMAETKKAKAENRGDRISEYGYLKVKIPDGHLTRYRKNGTSEYGFAHIIEMEKRLGRPLAKGEIIHHIDLDKTNCTIENLYLCANHKEHIQLHRSMEAICRSLFKEGKIAFDGKRYYRLEDFEQKGIE